MVYVLCVARVELLVLDACLVMGGVEQDPFCCNFDCFCFLFSRIQVGDSTETCIRIIC